jgi:hypothetical protein
MPTHAHPCYLNCACVYKNCVMCIIRLHQVLVGSDKSKVVHCHWFQLGVLLGWRIPCIREVRLWFGARWRDAQKWCPPMNNNIAPMPTQNPWAWAWVWAPNVGLCYGVVTSGWACLKIINTSRIINTLEWNPMKAVDSPGRLSCHIIWQQVLKGLWFLHAKFREGTLVLHRFHLHILLVPLVSCQLVWAHRANILGLCVGEIGLIGSFILCLS